MEFRLFGKSLFEITKSKGDRYYSLGQEAAKVSKFLPDFHDGFRDSSLSGFISVEDARITVNKKLDEKPAKHHKIELTPKAVHELKMLNDQAFKLNTDPSYIEEQLSTFKDKLALITSEEYDMRRGVIEIGSIIQRMENRKVYPENKEFFEQFPYTTTAKIVDLFTKHDYLKLGQVAQFLADMPKEASDVMKEYNKNTDKICKKQAVFYILANKKDFEKTNKRRAPILFAQSPFGHIWQILGAWDEEMLLVDQL